MLKNYFKTAWRHLLKNKLFTLINILGLAVGMAACLVIFQYVSFELSYDTFHKNKDHIYRVIFHNYTQGKFDGKFASTVSGLGPAMQATFSEEMSFARITPQPETIVAYQPKVGDAVKFIEESIVYADPSFLQIFSFPLIKGNLNTALSSPHTLIISASAARKYFKDEDSIGKLLSVGEGDPFLVQGVFEDMPKNSHIQFDFLLSYETLGKSKNEDWDWQDTYTYLLLPSSVSLTNFESKFTHIVKQHHREGSLDSYHLQPLTDIHLDDTLRSGIVETGSAKTVYFLTVIGVVLMLIALVNFINLTAVKNLERMKEIGIRKVMGATGMQLTRQFLIEAGLLNGFALILALGLILMAIPFFEQWGWQWFPIISWQQAWFWLFVGGLLLANTFIAGLHPVLSLSFFSTLQAIKMNTKPSMRGVSFSKLLIVFQFMASLVLLAGIVIIEQQLQFMKNQELAIDISQTVVIRAPYLTDQTTESKFQVFKNELEKYPAIRNITHSTSVPGRPIGWNRTDIKLESLDTERLFPSNIIAVGYDFVKTYQLNILAGRDFQEGMTTDAKGMLINEEAAKHFEFTSLEEALGHPIFIGNRDFHIIGVVNNYHHLSLKEAIDPILYFIGSTRRPIYSIKVNTDDLPTTLATIKHSWEQVYPGNVFSYFFLDEFFERQYQTDQQFGTVSSLFSGLTLWIACMGLFGLSSYTSVQRTKEMGIRKVLGASVSSILLLLSKGHLQLILIAFAIATPIANYFFTEWLNEFAYRIEVQWWMFILPGALVLLIALLSVSGQTVKAARKNPVDSLKYE